MTDRVLEITGYVVIVAAAMFTMTPTFWNLVRNGFYIFG